MKSVENFAIFLLIFGVSSVCSHRHHLNKNRKPHWFDENNGNSGPFYGQPEQVHLAYGGSPDKVIITWVTYDDTIDSIVEYGIERMNQEVRGSASLFVDSGAKQTKRYIHSVVLENIQGGKRYFYRVGSDYGWSSVFSFIGLQERPNGGYRYAVYGDMGNVNARSLGKIQKLAQNGDFDVVLHVGDLAYNMDTVCLKMIS
uniref:Purple acid phosphatase N-terminal domain-containing protein n=1 Tax=Acrobeloides nanus TaxID=290746 RepID=A0A914C5S6_9BILA